jgi:hypothetical protein
VRSSVLPHSCRLFQGTVSRNLLTLSLMLVLVSKPTSTCSHGIKISQVILYVLGAAKVCDWPLLEMQNNSRRGSRFMYEISFNNRTDVTVEVFTAVRMMMFFWVLSPCRLVGRCQHFGETYRLRWRQKNYIIKQINVLAQRLAALTSLRMLYHVTT